MTHIKLPSFIICFFVLYASQLMAQSKQLSFADSTILRGHFTQGGLVYGKTKPMNQVFFEQQAIRVSPEGDYLIAFHRDEASQVHLKIITPSGQVFLKTLAIEQRQYPIQRINGLAKDKVSPRKPAVLSRIKKERQQVAQARLRDDPRTDFLAPFIWPSIGPISGVYGSQRILNGQPRWPHFGVDVAAPKGSNVIAPAGGIISLAHPNMFFSGGTIILDHGHGLSSTFLHLSQLLVKVGDKVQQGDLIAKVGDTGRVTGAHLDWRMNLFKRRIDPQLLVEPMVEHFSRSQKNKAQKSTQYEK